MALPALRLGLQQKLLTIIAVAGLMAAAVSSFSLNAILGPAFQEIENRNVVDQAARATHVLQDIGLQMRRGAADYGNWDNAYSFMEDRNPAFLSANVAPTSVESIGMHAMLIYTPQGQLVFGRGITDLGNDDPARAAMLDQAVRQSGLLAAVPPGGPASTFVRTPQGLFAVGASPILHTDTTGASRGFIVMTRRLTTGALDEALRVPAALSATPDEASDRASIHSAVPVLDHRGRTLGYVNFGTPRTVTATGHRAVILASINALGVIVALMLIMTLAMRQMALKRVIRLEDHLRRLEASRTLEPIAAGGGDDEIDRLDRRFNALVLQLRDVREQLIVRSYDQGKADWASGALHKLRNALSPLSVFLDLRERSDKPQLRQRVRMAADELSGEVADPERRAALTRYLADGARQLAESADRQVEEVALAREGLRNVLDILNQQNAPAQARPQTTPVPLSRALASAAVVASHSPQGAIEVRLPQTDLVVEANEIILAQVLANLFANAADAINAAPASRRRIEVETRTVEDGPPAVEVIIRDDGEGIDPAVRSRLFEEGFTTRDDRSGGLGLHWVANNINRMGGRIEISSDGPGQGAAVTLRLKLNQQAAAQAA